MLRIGGSSRSDCDDGPLEIGNIHTTNTRTAIIVRVIDAITKDIDFFFKQGPSQYSEGRALFSLLKIVYKEAI
jgi:hypothetical protein